MELAGGAFQSATSAPSSAAPCSSDRTTGGRPLAAWRKGREPQRLRAHSAPAGAPSLRASVCATQSHDRPVLPRLDVGADCGRRGEPRHADHQKARARCRGRPLRRECTLEHSRARQAAALPHLALDEAGASAPDARGVRGSAACGRQSTRKCAATSRIGSRLLRRWRLGYRAVNATRAIRRATRPAAPPDISRKEAARARRVSGAGGR